MSVRITGIATEALVGYQPVMIDLVDTVFVAAGGTKRDYAVKACTAGARPLGYADVPCEASVSGREVRVPIVTNFIRTNGYVGVGGLDYGDELVVDGSGNYIKYGLPTALTDATVLVGATVTAYINGVGPVGMALETVDAGGVCDILLY